MSGRRHLVTGGAGFIGSNLVRALRRRGEPVRVLDDFSTGRRANLDGVDVELIEGRLEAPGDVARAVQGVTHIFHLGAVPSVIRSVEDPLGSDRANDVGTLNLLLAARAAGVERLVFSSSSSVYGETPGLPKREGEEGLPVSPYAVTKQAGEYYCRLFDRHWGLPTVCLRYFNVYGPRQDPKSHYAAVIPRFITAALAGRRPVVYGDGEQSRDFTFVEDAVQANLLAAERAGLGAGEVFNIACGERTSLLVLLAEIGAIVGIALAPEHAPPRAGDIRHSQADISRAAQRLGFTPRYSLRQGLEATVAWFQEQGERGGDPAAPGRA
ncbi:MAG: NAD-dependent epimerase/dehydratase family protein [Planctomycetes bacterium]|nr:NAD-dependent epimerase/dehydratase family protein [Planctomycetota bacterium]